MSDSPRPARVVISPTLVRIALRQPADRFQLQGLRDQADTLAYCLRDGIGSGDVNAQDALSLIANVATEVEAAETPTQSLMEVP